MIFVVLSVFLGSIFALVSSTPVTEQVEAVEGLISRVLGDEKYVKLYSLKIDSSQSSYFEIYGDNGLIYITAQDGIGLSSGFYYYIRQYTNSIFTWETKHIDTSSFPLPETKIVKNSLVEYRYMFNVCTFGYTMAMWNWEDWEVLIDWMALHGVNLPLSFVGQEYVWMKTFEKFGVTLEEMIKYFSGPLFLPWNRMGNIKRWGGPLSQHFINGQVTLQTQILKRQRSLGMIPVLPGYPGFVPDAFIKLYPNISVTKETPWGRFNETFTSVYLLDPTDPIFIDIGSTFLDVLNLTYGTDHIYNIDSFNEMQPKHADEKYLKDVSESIFKSLTKFDKNATWMLQGWLFYSDSHFWTNDRIKSYLSPVPNDQMMILDLFAEVHPVWNRTESFFSKPFIWCFLKNFGGRRGFYGNIYEFAKDVIIDKQSSSNTMSGTGITSEAIFVPPMPYELFSDLYLQEKPMMETEVKDWVMSYISQRYSMKQISSNFDWSDMKKAWVILTDKAYNYMEGQVKLKLDIVAVFPSFDLEFITDSDYYTSISESYHLFHKSFVSIDPKLVTDGLKYDYVDLTRQYLSNVINDIFNMIFVRYYGKEVKELESLTFSLLEVISDLDDILLTTNHFLLGKWIELARNKGYNDQEKDLFEWNARNQLSLWGPLNHGIDHDYAQKFWNGLVGDYYYNRWKIFFKYINKHPPTYDHDAYIKEQDQYEVFWQSQTVKQKKYPSTASLDIFETGIKIYDKYLLKSMDNFSVQKNCEPKHRLLTELVQVINRDLNSIAFLCKIDALCKGFTSDGSLFSEDGIKDTEVKQGIDLYVKEEK